MYNDIVTTVGKGNESFLVLLDLSAAFDRTDHDNLFYILEKYVGIGGSALRLIRSYISNRTQRVQIDGILSDFASLLCGEPQGSVLGPMKFCLYFLPFGAILRHHNIGYHINADDHISGICKSTHFHLRGIGRIRNLLTFDATAQLIHALINSRLDFCNSILYNLPNKQIERLQRIQNQAARMVKRIPRRNHITPVLRELHWLRIHYRIIFKILLLTHKAVNNTAPEYVCDLIRLNDKGTTIRTRASFDPCLLCVPPIRKTCANSLFDRSFVYAAPTLWNALDLDIRLLPFDAFKKGLRHIFI